MIEKADLSVKSIKSHSHNLSELLKEIGNCEIYKELTPGCQKWIRATEIRSIAIDSRFSNATAGSLLTAEGKGVSVYPNQIRYGDKLIHYPPEVMLEVAKTIAGWAKLYWDKIRIAQPGAAHGPQGARGCWLLPTLVFPVVVATAESPCGK